MKKFYNIFIKTFFFVTIPMILLAIIVHRRVVLPYIRITIGSLLISVILALAIMVFKSEKGKAIINVILGYIIIIPALYIFRYIFGQFLFRGATILYIIILVVGIIYGIAVFFTNKKYKAEVDELNRLLLEKDKNSEEER